MSIPTTFPQGDWISSQTPDWIQNLVPYIAKWASNGSYRDDGGAEAFGRIERRADKFGRPWMHTIFPPVYQGKQTKLNSEPLLVKALDIPKKIAETEFYIPAKYREFSQFSNGAVFFSGHVLLNGWRADAPSRATSANFEPSELHFSNYESRPPNAPTDLIVLGMYTYSSAFIFGEGERIHVSQDLGSRTTRTWEDFGQFMTEEFIRIDRLFDETGFLHQPSALMPRNWD
jgi:hypothetical protein